MKNFKSVLFLIFLILYVVGLCVGTVSQTDTENQNGMYEYLEGAVSGYNVTAGESIKQVLEDNVKILVLLVAGGILLIGPVVMAIVMIVKGYYSGFAITAMLRLFGMRGMLFCTPNLLSAAIIIPALSWYAVTSTMNLVNNRYEKREFLKIFFARLVIMIPILLVDGVIRGFLSAIIMKFASNG